MTEFEVEIHNQVDVNGRNWVHFTFEINNMTIDEIKGLIRQALGQVRSGLVPKRQILEMDELDAVLDPETRQVAVWCPVKSVGMEKALKVQRANERMWIAMSDLLRSKAHWERERMRGVSRWS